MTLRRDVGNVLEDLSQRSGIDRGELSRRFHRIKNRGSSPGTQNVNWIDDANGDVYDAPTGEVGHYIGNVFDDF